MRVDAPIAPASVREAPARTGSGGQLVSSSGRSMAEPFPEIVAALEQLPDGLVIDGELVLPTADGRSDFEEIRRRNQIQRPRMIQESAAASPAVLLVFDLLEADGEDLRARPLLKRRQTMHEARGAGPAPARLTTLELSPDAFYAISA